MVLLAALSKYKEKIKGKRFVSRRKSVKHLHRIVARRVSVVVNEKTKIESPTDVHHKFIRFPFHPVTGVGEIASPPQDVELHYTEAEMQRIAKELQDEAGKIRQVIEEHDSFEDDDENMTMKGIEEFVYPEKAESRLRSMGKHSQRVLLRDPEEGTSYPNQTCNPAA